MKKYFFALLLLSATGIHAFGQPVPVIKASSNAVDIRDGEDFQKGAWHISPEAKPDVYYANRYRRTKRVAFYTDIDSISFTTDPDKEYKFIILLNNKDTAYTIVSTASPSALQAKKKTGSGSVSPDTIPFRLGKGDKIYIKGRLNNSAELDFMFDTGSDQEVISKNGLSKKVQLHFNETKSSVTIGGTSTVQNSNGNKLEIGNLVWDNIPFARIDEADADGIIGYNAFDNRIVEIDYDKRIMVVHAQPFTVGSDYEKLPLRFKRNLPFVEASLTNGTKVVKGYFEFDAGSNGSLWLNKAFANENHLYESMERLGGTKTRGLDGKRVSGEKVVLPKFGFGRHGLTNVPIDLELASESTNFDWGILGMDILKRYNTILDLRHDSIYLKPNTLVGMPFHKPFNKYLLLVGLAAIACLLFVVRAVYKKKKVARKSAQASSPNHVSNN